LRLALKNRSRREEIRTNYARNTNELRNRPTPMAPQVWFPTVFEFSREDRLRPRRRNVGPRFERSVRWHFLAKTRNSCYGYFCQIDPSSLGDSLAAKRKLLAA
jgi:hypothetical protein